jgi:hypothetical protein
MKESNHIKDAAIELRDIDKPIQYLLDKFVKAQNGQAKGVKINKHQGNSKYLPISFVQQLLNTYYLGRWQVKNFKYQELYGQLCGTVELWVFNPITKEWLIHEGVAATQIRCKRETGKPITNGLTMDLPRLKADCIKNAAKDLGKSFGADLNRKEEAEYEARLSKSIDNQTYNIKEIKEAVKKIGNQFELLEYLNSNPMFEKDKKVYSLFTERKEEILRGDFA